MTDSNDMFARRVHDRLSAAALGVHPKWAVVLLEPLVDGPLPVPPPDDTEPALSEEGT